MKTEEDGYAWKLLALVLVIGLLAGIIGGVLSALLFIGPGPEGPQGETGPQGPAGPQGLQGPQGIAGTDGTDSVLQVVQNRNNTSTEVTDYPTMQWFNISDLDSSMEIKINTEQNSKIFAQFSGAHQLVPPAQIWMRIVVDNRYNSSRFMYAIGPAASGTYIMTGHIELLTDSLNAGLHAINVQLWIEESGSPTILDKMLDRTLTVIEIASQ